MQRTRAHALVERYIAGWKAGDAAQVTAALAPDCVIIESHGPTYRGVTQVERWVRAWIGAGGVVEQWDITGFYFAEDAAAVEWTFACTVEGEEYAFDGTSIIRFAGDRIRLIREYRMTDPPFDWEWIE